MDHGDPRMLSIGAVRKFRIDLLEKEELSTMIEPKFKGEPTKEQRMEDAESKKCKCGRCTRTGESSDSSQASSDLG